MLVWPDRFQTYYLKPFCHRNGLVVCESVSDGTRLPLALLPMETPDLLY